MNRFESSLRRYILGELKEASRLEVEERLITDQDAFETLGAIEDELADEYLDDTLSRSDRRRFESSFLTTPARRRQLRFVQQLKDYASAAAERAWHEPLPATSTAPMKGRWALLMGPRPLLTAAMAVLVATSVWFAVRSSLEERLLQTQIGQLTIQLKDLEGRLTAERLTSERQHLVLPGPPVAAGSAETGRAFPAAPSAPQAAKPPTFVLATRLLRGEGSLTRIIIPPDSEVIRLRLELPGHEYLLYRAVLFDAHVEEIWSQSKLKAEMRNGQPSITLVLPASLVSHGDYQVQLSGTPVGRTPTGLPAEIGPTAGQDVIVTYTFRVIQP